MRISVLPAFFLMSAVQAVSAAGPVYRDAGAPVEERVSDLLGRMTQEEKEALLSGVDSMDLPSNERLGIPRFRMTDGPMGVRLNSGEAATAFPAGILMAAAFDPDLVLRTASAMAEETLASGRDMLLGPCVNIARVPQGGRNFESYGEDPWLASRLSAAYVRGLQSRGVAASVKHYALNNQETDRGGVDVRVRERPLHEIYLPAFESAVRAGAWSVMAAYNKVNGRYASENGRLLNGILKERWGFKGFVVSDWGATHGTVAAANSGLDVEMPSGRFFGGGKLLKAVSDGAVSRAALDDKVRRVLRVMFGSGAFDRSDADRPPRSAIASPAHRALALEAAGKGMVLLKNEGGLLPLSVNAGTIAVIGPLAAVYSSGGGSSRVTPYSPVSPLDGLRGRAGAGVAIRYAQGVKLPVDMRPADPAWLSPPSGKSGASDSGLYGEYFGNRELKGRPSAVRLDRQVDFYWGTGRPADGVGADDFSVRWTGVLRVPVSGKYDIALRADDGTRLWIDGALVIDDWNDHAAVIRSARVRLEAGRGHALRLEYYERGGGAQVQLGFIQPVSEGIPEAAAAASGADAALVFAGYSDQLEGEGMDRNSLELPDGQDELIEAVAAANGNTVVVLQSGSPVLIGRWVGKVKAIIQAWYPGEEGGNAIADVLLGRVNPSGKLPVTWPARWEDSSAFGAYPGANGSVDYSEGIFTGYRHFDRKGIAPQFPFGHGLSYSTFSYSMLSADVLDGSAVSPEAVVSAFVSNTGLTAGAEVAQLYVQEADPDVERPEAELKGFQRVELAPGETKRVSFRLDRSAFAFYDEKLRDWRVKPGLFRLRVGSSSRDIRLTGSLELGR